MKKLYNKRGKVHPTPPVISDHLAFLPATIFTLTAALSPEDREVLAYLISCSGAPGDLSGGRKSAQKSTDTDHAPLFHCDCFRCYTSYWVRWDASPNRQLIHDIIDAFEDELTSKTKRAKSKKERRKRGFGSGSDELRRFDEETVETVVETVVEAVDEAEESLVEVSGAGAGSGAVGEDGGEEISGGEELEKGSVRRLVSFIGERIWGVFG